MKEELTKKNKKKNMDDSNQVKKLYVIGELLNSVGADVLNSKKLTEKNRKKVINCLYVLGELSEESLNNKFKETTSERINLFKKEQINKEHDRLKNRCYRILNKFSKQNS